MRSNVLRRAGITLAALVVVIGATGCFYLWRHRQIHTRYMSIRQVGFTAAAGGDYPTAVSNFERYLQRYPDDADAIAEYAHVRPMVELPDNAQIGNTIVALRHLLRLDPSRAGERRDLLVLYVQTGHLTEAEETASILHDQSAEQAQTLRYRTSAEIGLKKFAEALQSDKRWIEMAPDDLSARITRLWLLHASGQTDAAVLETAQKELNVQPQDPRRQLLVGFAYALGGDREKAAQAFNAAASVAPSDATFTDLLITQLDMLEMFNQSIAVLAKSYAASHSLLQRDALIRRYWELSRNADVASMMGTDPLIHAKADSEIQAIYSLSLHELKRDPEAVAVMSRLRAKKNDAVAAAWVVILQQAIDPKALDVPRLSHACQEALRSAPNDPYLSYFEGEAYARLNENDLAIEAWQKSADHSRTWCVPLLRLAETLSANGRSNMAMTAAQSAFSRSGGAVGPAIILARVWAESIDSRNSEDTGQLLKFVSAIQEKVPDDEQSLAIRLGLLVRAGQTADAQKYLKAALDRKSDLSEAAFLHLAALSQRSKLGLEDECFNQAKAKHGMSADLAFALAVRSFVAGKGEDGLHTLETCRASATEPNAVPWQCSWARYLDVIGDDRAKAAITRLADDQPGDVRVQQLALSARAPRPDRDFEDRTIQRLRKLTGDAGIAWQLARARWLLEFTTSGEENQQAINLLKDVARRSPHLIDANILLARAYERARELPASDGTRPDSIQSARDLSDAIEQLTTASKAETTSSSIGLYLVRLLQLRGDFERARDLLERIADRNLPDALQQRQAAELFSQQGESQRAIELMEEADRQSTEQGKEDLLLAELYRQRNQPQRAETICYSLLHNPKVPRTPAVIEFTADLQAALGRMDDAAKTMAMLDDLHLPSGVKEMAQADYASRRGDISTALNRYQAATQLAPENPATWRALIVACVAAGKVDQGLSIAQQAQLKNPKDPSLQAISRESALLKKAAADSDLLPLAVSFVREPTDDGAQQAINMLISAKATDSIPQSLARLAQLADRYPRLLPLQLYLARAYEKSGQLDNSIAASSRATQIAPNSAEAYALLTHTLKVAGKWLAALQSARQWRERTFDKPLAADVAIADIQIALNEAPAAVDLLQPYMNQKPVAPDVRDAYARAEVAMARGGYMDVMKVLLDEGTPGRLAWMRFAVQSLKTDAEAAIWLNEVAKVVPKDSVEEITELSESWGQLAVHSGNERYAQLARSTLAQLDAQPNPSPKLLLSRGIRSEQDGKLDVAADWYNQAIASSAASPDIKLTARNNLATVLANRGSDLSKAIELATASVKAHPDITPLYDTLAYVQGKARHFDDAVINENIALRSKPLEAIFHLDLAQLLADSGSADKAAAALRDIDDQHLDTTRLSFAQRQQLDSLRAKTDAGSANSLR